MDKILTFCSAGFIKTEQCGLDFVEKLWESLRESLWEKLRKFPQDGKYGGFTHFGVGFYTFRGVL